MRTLIASAACLLVAACSGSGGPLPKGDWRVDSDQSTVAFVTVKSGDIAEAHHFGRVTGAVTANGAAEVKIALDSVETKIDVRNQRIREFLFQTDAYPAATVDARLNPADFDKLGIGERMSLPLTATLSLHGVDSEIDATVSVTRIAADKVLVETTEPIIVKAETFGLSEGVEKLRTLAGLPSITPEAPVSFSIVFVH